MLEKLRPLTFGFAWLTAVVVSSSCDQVRKLTEQFKKPAETKPAFTPVYSSDQVATISASTYEAFVSQKNKLLVVDYYTDWCVPSQKLAPILEKAALAHPAVVFVGKVHAEKFHELADAQGVHSYPDVRFFKNGRQVYRIEGLPSESEFLQTTAALAKDITPDAPAAKPAKSNEPVLQPMKKDWMPSGMRKR